MTLRNVKAQFPDKVPAEYVPVILSGALVAVDSAAVIGNVTVTVALAPGANRVIGPDIEIADEVPSFVFVGVICVESTVTLP